jgi:hypothetical protein
MGSFDNMHQAMLAVFQILTLDSWSVICYLLMGNHVLP